MCSCFDKKRTRHYPGVIDGAGTRDGQKARCPRGGLLRGLLDRTPRLGERHHTRKIFVDQQMGEALGHSWRAGCPEKWKEKLSSRQTGIHGAWRSKQRNGRNSSCTRPFAFVDGGVSAGPDPRETLLRLT